MLTKALLKNQTLLKGTRCFATAKGDGITDAKNPKVFFEVAKNGASMGKIQFEVSNYE